MNLIKNAAKNIFDRLTWHTARKDQAGITRELADGKEVHEIYGLGEASLFDEFFNFLDELGFNEAFVKLKPKRRDRESPIPFEKILLIYFMRIVAGLQFFNHIDTVLLHSQSLMRLIGFNGRVVKEGGNKRGLHKIKDQNKEQGTAVRGPVCAEFVASKITAITAPVLEKVFNKTISILAANSFFPRKIHALLDASDIESTEACEGCGYVKKEKAPELRRRRGRIKKIFVTVFGFKIWVVWDPRSKLPLAMRFATINVHDLDLARKVIEQAISNLGEYAGITSIAIDRGFMDGKLLHWLDSEGITFYIPAKRNQEVYKDALSLVESGQNKIRTQSRFTGYGKNRQEIVDTWEMVGIEGLTSAGFYGELGSGSHENRKDFVANPINAVVVLRDPYTENNPNCQTLIILTNGPVNDPLQVYDEYDARSEIENSLFRESKQAWFIKRPPQQTKAGFMVHAYLTILIMALTTAYRDWMIKQDKLEQKGKETGARKFRQKIREENSNKFIIFNQGRYAIFLAYEVLILCGTRVLKPTGVPEKITKEDILLKYGAQRE